jgi:hypothetical protein
MQSVSAFCVQRSTVKWPNQRVNRTGQGVKCRKFHAVSKFRLKCRVGESSASRLAAPQPLGNYEGKISTISKHREKTKILASGLNPDDIFTWLCTKGYFPENYVLPPCYCVERIPPKHRYTPISKKNYKPSIHELVQCFGQGSRRRASSMALIVY